MNSMNREQRERYEHGEADYKIFRDFRVFRGENYSGHSISESHPRFRLVFTPFLALDADQAAAAKLAEGIGPLLFRRL